MNKIAKVIVTLLLFMCTACFSGCGISYNSLTGQYENSSMGLCLWLYDDGTFVETDRFGGWYNGYYEYSNNGKGNHIVHLMKYYPPILDTFPTLLADYENTMATPRFQVLDQDGSKLKINRILWQDSAENTDSHWEKEGLSEGEIPRGAVWIRVDGNGGVYSDCVKIKDNHDIIFHTRPNFNNTNLQWSRKTGLVYKSEYNIYKLKKKKLHPKLRVTIPQ
ncbi:MAG: hypothetical protein K5867_05345 [Bacteroidales bacterium]|nr:hypothetical protein [Bacteroidales bacterium]